jgi:hypothetical protein
VTVGIADVIAIVAKRATSVRNGGIGARRLFV